MKLLRQNVIVDTAKKFAEKLFRVCFGRFWYDLYLLFTCHILKKNPRNTGNAVSIEEAFAKKEAEKVADNQ